MNSPQNQLPSRKQLAVLAIPMLVAFGISSYLTYASMTSSPIAGCGGGKVFDCGHVLYSKWSKLAGIPVSSLALLTYVAMLIATAIVSINRFSNQTRHNAWMTVTGLSIAASLAAAYFVFLQVVVLKHLCAYCLVAHGCGLAIVFAVLSLYRIPTRRLTFVASVAAIGLTVMVAIQINTKPPKKYVIQSYQAVAHVGNRVEVQSEFESNAGDGDEFFAPPVDEDELFAPPVDE